jgi:hypothetical protein
MLQSQLDQIIKENPTIDHQTDIKITEIKDQIDELLEVNAKKLAQKARVQWIEKGEKNNRYFLNLIKHNRQKQRINELIVDNKSLKRNDHLKEALKDFYQDLYRRQDSEPCDSIINDQITVSENLELCKVISPRIRKYTEGSKRYHTRTRRYTS